MSIGTDNPWPFRISVATACVALLPIIAGALVTTLDAGMAFPDWPTSNGQGMFAFPWLQSAGDEFIEHGHRLAGTLVGMFSIVMAAVLWKKDKRTWVKVLGVVCLLGVIGQGLLGGIRVLAANRAIAQMHGSFAAVVFTLMAAVALFTCKSWKSAESMDEGERVPNLKIMSVLLPIALMAQYILGSFVRHQGNALHAHLGFAFIVLVFVMGTSLNAFHSNVPWLQKPGYCLMLLILLQITLGAGAWVTKFGFPPAAIVAVQHSSSQIFFRTAHTVVGMLLFMTSVVLTLRVFRLDSIQTARLSSGNQSSGMSLSGGVG